MKKVVSGIYKITHKNEMYYLGCSVDIFNRFNQHYKDLLDNCHSSVELQKLFNESKIEDFSFTIYESKQKEEYKKETGLVGQELDKAFKKYLLKREKEIMNVHSITFALNKRNKQFA